MLSALLLCFTGSTGITTVTELTVTSPLNSCGCLAFMLVVSAPAVSAVVIAAAVVVVVIACCFRTLLQQAMTNCNSLLGSKQHATTLYAASTVVKLLSP